ncbi:MAG: hypothetical protein IJJ41_05075 [Clostridia bacterium]|nr:hypothetical protein [Clostridia bacterium]
MDLELFFLELSNSQECQKILPICWTISGMGVYYAKKHDRCIEPFMFPLINHVKNIMRKENIDVDQVINYIISNDRTCSFLCLIPNYFKRKKYLSYEEFLTKTIEQKIITPFIDDINYDSVALMISVFVIDNLCTKIIDINLLVKNEQFIYPTNQYGLTKVNGAIFKKDGLIFKEKGYYYNVFTNKSMINPYDESVGFAKLIEETAGCDILYRIDENLSVPKNDFHDFTGICFEKFRGPQFCFDKSILKQYKTIIVHYDKETFDKLLFVIKKDVDKINNSEFWHIEIETLPHVRETNERVITTFLHGIYFPLKKHFTHIDYAKNQYNGEIYQKKYCDCQNGISIDHHTESRELHYKIWCIENGIFTEELWFKLMLISLPEKYQALLNEMFE